MVDRHNQAQNRVTVLDQEMKIFRGRNGAGITRRFALGKSSQGSEGGVPSALIFGIDDFVNNVLSAIQ
jgi:hypothetical protein